MNLFILSLDPAKIAEYMMDKHIAKIILEAVQMLCSTKRLLDADEPTLVEMDNTVGGIDGSPSWWPQVKRSVA